MNTATKSILWFVSLIAAVGSKALTIQFGSPLSALCSYVFFGIFLFPMVHWAVNLLLKEPKVSKPVAIVCIVAFMAYCARIETFSERIRESDGALNVIDRLVWSGKPVYLMVFESKESPTLIWKGPLSETGKHHGMWTSVPRSAYANTVYSWYWYGEMVTEGEWHRLNGGK